MLDGRWNYLALFCSTSLPNRPVQPRNSAQHSFTTNCFEPKVSAEFYVSITEGRQRARNVRVYSKVDQTRRALLGFLISAI